MVATESQGGCLPQLSSWLWKNGRRRWWIIVGSKQWYKQVIQMQFHFVRVVWIDIGPAYRRVSGSWVGGNVFQIFFWNVHPEKLGGRCSHPFWRFAIFFRWVQTHSTQPPGMLTLFMSITGGLSWIDALEALTSFSFFALTFFVIYIVPWLTTGNHRYNGCRWWFLVQTVMLYIYTYIYLFMSEYVYVECNYDAVEVCIFPWDLAVFWINMIHLHIADHKANVERSSSCRRTCRFWHGPADLFKSAMIHSEGIWNGM